MKLLFVWLINTIIVLPFKVIRLVIKIIYQVIKNIYFNNLNLDYINNLDGYQFEAFTKTLLEKNGFKDVRISKSSNDYSIDILAKKDNYTYAIQCKRYNKPVGIKAIQEAIAGCVYYQCDIPVVFTNSTFSKAAINLANINDVELWDHDMLCYFLKKSKLLSKNIPFYYPIISLLITILLCYVYFIYNQLLIILLISVFIFISILIKMINNKKKTLFITTKPKIHDYSDTIN